MAVDVIIIGAGVIGLACAHFLNKLGRGVTILEKDAVGGGASYANCGLVFTSDILPLCCPGAVSKELARMVAGTSSLAISPACDPAMLAWFVRFALHCNQVHLRRAMAARRAILDSSMQIYGLLVGQEGIECQWQQQGVLLAFRRKEHLDAYRRVNDLLAAYGLAAERISGDRLWRFEPALGKGVCGAWFHPHDAHLKPDLLTASWKELLLARGVKIVQGCRVTGFQQDGARVRAVETTSGRYEAAEVVVAAGAWSRQLVKKLGIRLPVEPAKGYSITMERPLLTPRRPCYLYESNVVATPFGDGFRLGGTLEFAGLDLRLNPGRLDNLKQGARLYLKQPLGPRLQEQWASVRPMSPDDLPVIGPAPGWRNVYLATGHGMMGISMAPATGRLLAELIAKIPAHIDPEPFAAGRFRI